MLWCCRVWLIISNTWKQGKLRNTHQLAHYKHCRVSQWLKPGSGVESLQRWNILRLTDSINHHLGFIGHAKKDWLFFLFVHYFDSFNYWTRYRDTYIPSSFCYYYFFKTQLCSRFCSPSSFPLTPSSIFFSLHFNLGIHSDCKYLTFVMLSMFYVNNALFHASSVAGLH